jgi:hypothetical protein
MFTTCFDEYGHHQVSKYVVGKLLLFIVLLLCMWSLRCARVLCLVHRAPLCSSLRVSFSEYFGFPCQLLLHRLLHAHHISSGAGAIGQLVADVPSGLKSHPTPRGGKRPTFPINLSGVDTAFSSYLLSLSLI